MACGYCSLLTASNFLEAVRTYLQSQGNVHGPLPNDPVSCTDKSTLLEIITKLDEAKIHRIYVLNPEGDLKGIVTLRDIISTFVEEPLGYFKDFFAGVVPATTFAWGFQNLVHIYISTLHMCALEFLIHGSSWSCKQTWLLTSYISKPWRLTRCISCLWAVEISLNMNPHFFDNCFNLTTSILIGPAPSARDACCSNFQECKKMGVFFLKIFL